MLEFLLCLPCVFPDTGNSLFCIMQNVATMCQATQGTGDAAYEHSEAPPHCHQGQVAGHAAGGSAARGELRGMMSSLIRTDPLHAAMHGRCTANTAACNRRSAHTTKTTCMPRTARPRSCPSRPRRHTTSVDCSNVQGCMVLNCMHGLQARLQVLVW